MIPKFDKYACVGDSVTWTCGPFDMRATLHADDTASPRDFDCYDPEQVASWDADDWRFVGVVVTASIEGVELACESLWGVDCNFPGGTNDYLSEVAGELEDKAVAAAREKIAAIGKAAA